MVNFHVIDSFDHYTTDQFTKKWNAKIGIVNSSFEPPAITTAAGRRGYGLVTRKGGSAWRSFADLSTLVVGFAFRPMGIVNKRIAALRDEGTIQLYLQMSTAGRVQVFRGNGTLLGTSAQTFSSAKYYYIELRAVISSSAGSLTLRINGDSELGFTVSSINTQVSPLARVNILQFGDPTTSNIHFHYDDVMVNDGTLIGPQYIDVLRPNGGVAGYMDMSVVGAGSHYQALDDTTPDDDTSYVYSSSSNRGTFLSEFEDIREPLPTYIPAASGAIHAVGLWSYERKEHGNTRALSSALMPGTADGAAGSILYVANDPLYIETEYAYHGDIYANNPGTGGTWSITSINALRAGQVRIA